jgi:hypothetical protein
MSGKKCFQKNRKEGKNSGQKETFAAGRHPPELKGASFVPGYFRHCL